jgi:N-acetyl-gamma-glutamyl-phosphate reductase
MIRVAILGATGYTARELLELLLRHPEVEVTALATRSEANLDVADVHPSLRSRLDLRLENLTPGEVAKRADCVFGCLPHGASAAVISELLAAGCRVIDFSADYRLNDPQVYEKWYQVVHPDPQRLGKVAYGLPELFREQIRGAQLVANPGCYPTAAILALAPLLKAGAISPQGIIIDAKSGISGAGRTPKPNFHFPEANENLTPYNIGKHRHTPEIDQILSTWANVETNVVFTPHLIPMDRGELVTAYADVPKGTTGESLLATLRDFYKNEPFVRIVDHLPGTKDVSHTNFCDVTARVVGTKAVVVSVIDNLIKGASGAAVQNFNVVYGFPETTALL